MALSETDKCTVGITYTDGGRGTATLEPGKRGGTVVVLRRGYPVAAEIVAAFPADRLDLLALVGVTADPESVRSPLLAGEEVAR